jgi:hypothetical protein
MSTTPGVTLNLDALALQLSPFVPTDEDRRRARELAIMTMRKADSRIEKAIDDFFAMGNLVLDLLLKSTAQSHPELTRADLAENLNQRNLPLAIDALTRMSELTLTRMLSEMPILGSRIN